MKVIDHKRQYDSAWNFRNHNTKEYTHCYHAYPAMMIPQIARKLIQLYGQDAKLLFDPYCGTATSLVEANLKDIDAIGTDLNPLARLIAKAKTTVLDLNILDSNIKDFVQFKLEFQFGQLDTADVETPDFFNIDFWFNEHAKKKLTLIKGFIDDLSDERVRLFFLTAFSETVRLSSLTRNGEFKLIRLPKSKRAEFDPDSFAMMHERLIRNRNGLRSYLDAKDNESTAKIFGFNTVEGIPKIIIPNKVDIVVTSPPYGDSKTTVAYGQYSRLANQWMGYNNASKVDKELMGGRINDEQISTESEVFHNIIDMINDKDPKRAKEVLSFFIDYKKSIKNIAEIISNNGYACYVVGNRTVKGIQIPMDLITRDFFEESGFVHRITHIRDIPNKRMPSKNSPSNKPGKTSSTMKQEYIVVCQKSA